uniref:Uncharacterized protein n=1 Tax=Oryza rufipogon TaxID=4529 RepID=A0A0E0RCF0_ORYRU
AYDPISEHSQATEPAATAAAAASVSSCPQTPNTSTAPGRFVLNDGAFALLLHLPPPGTKPYRAQLIREN